MHPLICGLLLACASGVAAASDVDRIDALQQRKDANQLEIEYLTSEVQLKELRAKAGQLGDDEIVLPLLTAIMDSPGGREAEFRHRDGTLRVREGQLLIPGWFVMRIADGAVRLQRKGIKGQYVLRLGSPWPTRER